MKKKKQVRHALGTISKQVDQVCFVSTSWTDKRKTLYTTRDFCHKINYVMPDHIIQKCSPAFFPFLIVYLYARIKNDLGEPRIKVSTNFINKECSGL